MLGLTKFRVFTNIFYGLKNHKFLKFIYNNKKFRSRWSYDYPELNVEPLVMPLDNDSYIKSHKGFGIT